MAKNFDDKNEYLNNEPVVRSDCPHLTFSKLFFAIISRDLIFDKKILHLA